MMGDEDHNPEIIRKESKELSNIRKEQQTMRLWVGVLLGTNLLLLAGFLWVSGRDRETKQPVPAETDFQYPPPAPPAEEDSSIWVTDKIPDDASNTDNTDYADTTDETDNMHTDTADYTDYVDETNDANNADNTEESPSPAVPVVVKPVTTRPVTIRPATRTVKKAAQPRRTKKVAAIPVSIITRPGMTLRSLARRYYGREVFWIYIYDRNMGVLSSLDTSSSDALPSGIELKLPRPVDYGIDATEPISLQRACDLAKSLAKQ